MDLLRRGLKLSHIRLIAALQQTGQMSAAATLLNISQPAASRLAAELETIIGVNLHIRHPRGVTLTRYGEHLAARAQTMLRGLQDAGREITELQEGLRGSVSIGAVSGPSIELVIPVIDELRLTHPQLTLSVLVDTSVMLADALLAGTLDFYLGRIPDNLNARMFRTRIIGEEPVSIIVRNNHPLTQKKEVELKDLANCEWVMQDEGSLLRQTVEAYFIKNGIPLPERVLSTSSTLLTLVTVSQTDALAPIASAVASYISDKDGLGGNISSLDIAPDLAVSPCYLISKEKEPLSPAASIVYDTITAQLSANQLAKNEAEQMTIFSGMRKRTPAGEID
ncbi:MAG TPA: LysR substrate-binding domain-containing protein [Hyphomicrobiales bacterium]|nr:LysR substrate-binding domain-containing protein [Hyphomicrobiales bacterium]